MILIYKRLSRYLKICILLVFLFLAALSSKAQAQFFYYNPFLLNPGYNQILSVSDYTVWPNINTSNTVLYPQNFSYKDYYAAYPYLQLESSNKSGVYNVNNENYSGGYVNNSTNYAQVYSPSPNIPNYYIPNQNYQPVNYNSLASSTYQTVNSYTENASTGNQTQTYQQAATYNQTYIPFSQPQAQLPYIPVSQQNYYIPVAPPNIFVPPLPNLSPPNVYIPPQPQVNTYIPSNNGYVSNQTLNTGYYIPNNGYYVPNANYWPNVTIEDPEPPADIEGEYTGEWESDTTGDDGKICAAQIEQDDTQIYGTIKLKGFVISAEGKLDLTGTVDGTTVIIEIDIDGPILEFTGTVESNGDIVGTYVVEGSSSVLDEGTIILEPR